jgi:hypothetical protein
MAIALGTVTLLFIDCGHGDRLHHDPWELVHETLGQTERAEKQEKAAKVLERSHTAGRPCSQCMYNTSIAVRATRKASILAPMHESVAHSIIIECVLGIRCVSDCAGLAPWALAC